MVVIHSSTRIVPSKTDHKTRLLFHRQAYMGQATIMPSLSSRLHWWRWSHFHQHQTLAWNAPWQLAPRSSLGRSRTSRSTSTLTRRLHSLSSTRCSGRTALSKVRWPRSEPRPTSQASTWVWASVDQAEPQTWKTKGLTSSQNSVVKRLKKSTRKVADKEAYCQNKSKRIHTILLGSKVGWLEDVQALKIGNLIKILVIIYCAIDKPLATVGLTITWFPGHIMIQGNVIIQSLRSMPGRDNSIHYKNINRKNCSSTN